MKSIKIDYAGKIKFLGFLCCIAILGGCASAKQPPPPPESENEILVSRFEDGDLIAKETERGVVVYLPSVFFTSGSSDMTEIAIDKVRYIATVSNEDFVKDRLIVLEGHTDSQGSESNNMKLSKARAKKMEAFLIDNNLDAGRINAFWFGESMPLVPNHFADGTVNPEGLSTNRRVEFVMLN